jgi:hypothetical protein
VFERQRIKIFTETDEIYAGGLRDTALH